MRIAVYRDDTLAATFEHGREAVYHGTAGREVRRLVERQHQVRNLWTGQVSATPADDRLDWWASRITSAGLRQAGFAVRFDLPVTRAAPDSETTGHPDAPVADDLLVDSRPARARQPQDDRLVAAAPEHGATTATRAARPPSAEHAGSEVPAG